MIRWKPKSKEKREEQKALREKDWNFFLHIWRKRKHDSEISGDWLGPEPLSSFFHHILPRRKYEKFRWLEENIILLTIEEHGNVENNPEKYPEINQRREKLLALWEESNYTNQEGSE